MTQHNPLASIDHFRIAAATIIVLLAAVLASPVAAQTATNVYPTVLQQMIDTGKVQVIEQFPTDKPGMTGYIVKRGGYQTAVYGEDGYLILGPLYGPEGRNLSQLHARQYKPEIDVGQTINSLDDDYFVTQGPAHVPTLYVFADPNCIFCHALYKQAQPLIDAGKLQIHWIMVGVLGSSSIGRAATILNADEPTAALARNEAGFKVRKEQGGVPVTRPGNKLRGILDSNRKAMFSLGSTGTPAVVFADGEGNLHVREGLPPDGWLTRYTNG